MMPPSTVPRREAVSIVCVFNKADVLRECLERSMAASRHEAPETEIVPIDNTARTFATAGAALNYGAAHGPPRLSGLRPPRRLPAFARPHSTAAGRLADDPRIGLLGAAGIAADGSRPDLRDRILLRGVPLREPTAIDSLDEVLFMVRARWWSGAASADRPSSPGTRTPSSTDCGCAQRAARPRATCRSPTTA